MSTGKPDAVLRVRWVADRDPTPDEVESFKAFLVAHPDVRGGAVNVDGVIWTAKELEYEQRIEAVTV